MRRSGLLLHPTSLPGGPIGTLGAEARAFVDFLAEAGQSAWQMLPVGPGRSPYMGLSVFAGNPFLIDPGELVADGLLKPSELPLDVRGPVDFALVESESRRVLDLAVARFDDTDADYAAFNDRANDWLGEWAAFSVLEAAYSGALWVDWAPEHRDRNPAALSKLDTAAVRRARVVQYLFDRQWRKLRAYASERGVELIGDIPIFVGHGSVDVWANRDLFDLDARGRCNAISGVPPDYFSPTGQRWGNPLYRWDAMAAEGYAWWIDRFEAAFALFDAVRVDHFRGFEAYWRIPADAETAIDGAWQPGPGRDLFDALAARVSPQDPDPARLPIIVEDLGIITPDVEALRDGLGLPGMKVLQFGFDGSPTNPHLPANYPADGNCVVYTGTHDNDTAVGWYAALDPHTQHLVRVALSTDAREIAWDLVTRAWNTSARLAVAPVQDVLELGSDARMNTPGTMDGNWSWRMEAGALTPAHAARLRSITEDTGRR